MRRSRLGALAPLALVVLLGCSSGPLPSPSLRPAAPSPTAPAALATATAAPTPTATPTAEPRGGLRIGGMATITVDGLRRFADPADPSSRPRLNRRYGQLNSSDRVFLVDGPQTVDGVDYWQLWPSYWHESSPLGWARATRANGKPTMVAYQPDCPAAEPTLADVVALDGLERLVCFGDRELTLRGTVHCDRPIKDAIIGGAPWMSSQRSCQLSGQLWLEGDPIYNLLEQPAPVERITGRYEVRGHFDDAGARRCHSIPFGTSQETEGPAEPGPVMVCRQAFVVSAVSELE